MLFSATQTKNVEDLARISLRKAPLYIGVDDNKETSTVDGLEQVSIPLFLKSEFRDRRSGSILVSYRVDNFYFWRNKNV